VKLSQIVSAATNERGAVAVHATDGVDGGMSDHKGTMHNARKMDFDTQHSPFFFAYLSCC
jgi:hypothetical protein